MRNRAKKIISTCLVAAYVLSGIGSVSAIERVYILPATTQQKAPKSNMFQLKGSSAKYILLDNTDEGYFILTEKSVGSKPLSKDGSPVPFDPENPNSVAHWLNHDFLDEDVLPEVIKEHIIEREYTTEGGGSKVPFSKEYKTKCKLVLLSQTEWSKYNSKFGYADDGSLGYWGLRSVRELTGSPLVAAVGSPNSGLTVDGKWSSSLGIRPAFYLSKDFFENASVDMDNTGDTVLSIIRKNYSAEVLQEIYSTNDVVNLMSTDIAPLAESVTVSGRAIVGEEIKGSYSFVSLDDNTENGTMIQWEKSLDGNSWSTILGADSVNYVPSQDEIGYYVRMKVSPMTESMAGASFTSVKLSNKIRPISTPKAENVRIIKSGAARPGNILDVKYSYSDENRDICSGTEYIWESSDDMLTAEKIGASRNYKLTNNEAGKYVRVGVIPRKQTNSKAGRQTVTGVVAYSEWTQVDNLPTSDSVTISREADAKVNLSKTEDGVNVSGLLMSAFGNGIEKLTASYNMEAGDGYTVVCQWQGSSEKDGTYSHIASGTNTLEYVPSGTVWVRARVYTKNSDGISNSVYSEPMYIGEDKEPQYQGSLSVTENLKAGKTYEIWIINDTYKNSYTYSFKITSGQIPTVLSDKYTVKNIPDAGCAYVLGTLVSDTYSGENCFKAGEIVADANTTITISDVLTTSVGSGMVSGANVFILEK